MFLKFGKREHIEKLKKGYMWFNPCIKFRQWENDDMTRDPFDGGMAFSSSVVHSKDLQVNNLKFSTIIEPAKTTPIYCLKYVTQYEDLHDEISELIKQFPEYDTVLIIDDEVKFLSQVSYMLNKKIFAHKIFYQDVLSIDFVDFIFNGVSDISFISPIKQRKYYMEIMASLNNQEDKYIKIDDSNYFKAMYSKGLKYSKQNEYRLVLPWKRINDGTSFYVGPIDGSIKPISTLVGD